MKRYRIISVIFAKDMKSAFKKIDDAEIVDIELMDELKNPINSNIGFR